MAQIIKLPVVPECKKCENVLEDGTCRRYGQPGAWWRNGRICPMASHLKTTTTESKKAEKKKRVGQQKQIKKKGGK